MFYLYKVIKEKRAQRRREREAELRRMEHEDAQRLGVENSNVVVEIQNADKFQDLKAYAKSERPSTWSQTKILLELQFRSESRAFGWVLAKFIWPLLLFWFNNKGFGEQTPYYFNWTTQFFQGFYIMLVLMAFSLILSIPIVEEHKDEIRRGLFLMGVRKQAYFYRFYIWSCLSALIGGAVLMLPTRLTKMWVETSAGVAIISLLLTTFQAVPIVSVIVVFSKRHTHSVVASLVSLVVQCLIFIGIFDSYNGNSSTGQNLGASILTILGPASAADFQWGQIYFYECLDPKTGLGRGGLQFNQQLWNSGVALSWIMQLCSIAIWTCVFLYVVKPSQIHTHTTEDAEVTRDPKKFEPLPKDAKVAIRVRNLVKEFDDGEDTIKAIDGLNMDILENEVFGFLGHNGAGKSTTISIMSCEHLQTAGSVNFKFLDGTSVDIGAGQDSLITSKIGVCPQSDFLFPKLTCREHLELYARLKGSVPMGPEDDFEGAVSNQASRLIEAIKFTSTGDEDRRVEEYSGGMKRKVSIAVAMLGAPDVIFLDEPTAGMDPFNRRRIWDLINSFKKGCSVVLTTHFMDEADILSDRIGVINHGKLVTVGTSLFLKHRFGAGYNLTFIHDDKMDSLVKSIVPNAVYDYSEASTEFENLHIYHWMIPYGNESIFSSLLEKLEQSGCKSTSVTNTTLEQVFLKTGAETADEAGLPKKDSSKLLSMEGGVDTSELANRMWNRKGLDRNPSSFKRALAASDLTLISWWGIAGLLYFVIYPIVFAIAATLLWKFLETYSYVKLNLPAALMAWMCGMLLMPLVSLVRDISQLNQREFFGVLRLMGAPKLSSFLGVVLFRCALLFTISYIAMLIMSGIVGSPLTATFAGWLTFTLVFVLMFYGWAPWLSLLSSFVKSAKLGMVLASVIGYVFHLVLFGIVFITGIIDGISNGVLYGLSIFPLTAGQIAIMNIAANGAGLYNSSNPVKDVHPTWNELYKWDNFVLYPIIMMAGVGSVGWLLLVISVRDKTHRNVGIQDGSLSNMDNTHALDITPLEDPDVCALDTLAMDPTVEGIKLQRMKKYYKNGKTTKRAVDGISIAVEENQTFALLGPNGAGKTQTMKMATGGLRATSGNIILGDARLNMDQYFATGKCGYVPQMDVIWPEATVRQHLNFALKIKGIDAESAKEHMDAIIEVLGLEPHLDKKSKKLSGGYKRKLCFAIALVGSPEVLFLDEVSTGVDPGSRHEIWSILRPKHRSVPLPAILISTHFMDEAEYVAHKVGIMIDGKMITAGSVDRLSEKHCTFNIVDVIYQPEADLNASIKTMLENLPQGAEMTECMNRKATFKIPRDTGMSIAADLGRLFSITESMKEPTNISFYSVSRMSLEQIFMEQCKKQFDSSHYV